LLLFDLSFIKISSYILNRLEQLEFIPSAEEWKKLRELRNNLTHTYPWEKEILINEIKEALKYSEKMINIFQHIKEKLQLRKNT